MRDHTRKGAAGMSALLVAALVLAGCGSEQQNVTLEVRLVEEAPSPDLTAMTMRVWGDQRTYYAHDDVLMDETDVSAAMVITRDDGAPAMKLIFAGEGRKKLQRITQENVGKRMGIVIGGQLQCAPVIHEPNTSGIVIVTGHMLERAARKASQALTRNAAKRTNGGEPHGTADGRGENPPT